MAPTWTLDSTSTLDCLDTALLSEEEILEEMMVVDRPWEDLHDHSYLLPLLQEVESRFSELFTSDVCTISNPLAPAQFHAEDNLSVISKMISIKISMNPNMIENLFIRVECSPEEIQVIQGISRCIRLVL